MWISCTGKLYGPFIALIGLVLLPWAWRVWRRPDLPKPGSFWYRNYQVWLQSWQPWKWKSPPERLTHNRIRLYGATQLAGGILLLAIGICTTVWL